VKDEVVSEEEEVMGVIEALDVVHVVVQEIPATVKLVNGQCRQSPDAWLQTDADQPLAQQNTCRAFFMKTRQ